MTNDPWVESILRRAETKLVELFEAQAECPAPPSLRLVNGSLNRWWLAITEPHQSCMAILVLPEEYSEEPVRDIHLAFVQALKQLVSMFTYVERPESVPETTTTPSDFDAYRKSLSKEHSQD